MEAGRVKTVRTLVAMTWTETLQQSWVSILEEEIIVCVRAPSLPVYSQT